MPEVPLPMDRGPGVPHLVDRMLGVPHLVDRKLGVPPRMDPVPEDRLPAARMLAAQVYPDRNHRFRQTNYQIHHYWFLMWLLPLLAEEK